MIYFLRDPFLGSGGRRRGRREWGKTGIEYTENAFLCRSSSSRWAASLPCKEVQSGTRWKFLSKFGKFADGKVPNQPCTNTTFSLLQFESVDPTFPCSARDGNTCTACYFPYSVFFLHTLFLRCIQERSLVEGEESMMKYDQGVSFVQASSSFSSSLFRVPKGFFSLLSHWEVKKIVDELLSVERGIK